MLIKYFFLRIGWSIGTVGGPLAGGLLYDKLGYNSVFIFALVISKLIYILAIHWGIPSICLYFIMTDWCLFLPQLQLISSSDHWSKTKNAFKIARLL
jgi:MFS family permease